MSLLVDLGNTRLKCAFADGDTVRDVFAFTHAGSDFIAQLGEWLVQHDVPDAIWLASVASETLTQRVASVFELAGHRVLRVVTQPHALGLRVAYADASRLGVDRWLAMLAARAQDASPVLVASVGSALTVDGIDPAGQHLGGLIAPTPEAMREALFARAPHLRSASGRIDWFNDNTEDAVASGALLACVALIERAFDALSRRLGTAPRLVLSGGGIAPLRAHLPPHTHTPNLVLDGLARWVHAQT